MTTLLWFILFLGTFYLEKVVSDCAEKRVYDTYYGERLEFDCENADLVEIFNYFDKDRILVLNIEFSALEHIDSKLSFYSNLRKIYVRNCDIVTIRKEIFVGLNYLTFIDVALNNISTIEDKSFFGLHSLRSLNISHNLISDVNFLNYINANISVIDVSHNSIVQWEDNTFEGLRYLTSLNLSSNLITRISTGTFKDLVLLNRLDLSNNSINFANWAVSDAQNLSAKFTNVSGENCFSGLRTLEYLNLQHNRITNIPIGIFKDLQALSYLNLSNNDIITVNTGSFAGLRNLSIIDLSANKINYLSEHILPDLNNVVVFCMNDNLIEDINMKYFLEHLPKLHEICIDGNNWSCTKLSDIIRDLNSHNVVLRSGKYFHGSNLKGIACKDDTRTKSKSPGSNLPWNNTNAIRVDASDINAALESFKSYFETDFKNSEFYKFFRKSLQDEDLIKQMDSNFLKSKFYKYISGGYENNTIFDYLDKKFKDLAQNDVDFNQTNYQEHFKKILADHLSLMSSEYNKDYLKNPSSNEQYDVTMPKNFMIAIVFILLLMLCLMVISTCRSLKIKTNYNLKLMKRLYRKNVVQEPKDVLL